MYSQSARRNVLLLNMKTCLLIGRGSVSSLTWRHVFLVLLVLLLTSSNPLMLSRNVTKATAKLVTKMRANLRTPMPEMRMAMHTRTCMFIRPNMDARANASTLMQTYSLSERLFSLGVEASHGSKFPVQSTHGSFPNCFKAMSSTSSENVISRTKSSYLDL